MKRICTLALVGFTASAFAQVTVSDFAGGVTAVNHPYTGTPPTTTPNGVNGTWYDITSDAFSTPLAGTLSGSPAMKVEDGGFTNGVYCRFGSVVPSFGLWKVRVKWAVNEVVAQPNGIRGFQMGIQVNGVHRTGTTNPNDLPNPTSAVANYSGPLTTETAENHTAAPYTDETGAFLATTGDSLVVAFATSVSGNYDGNSGTWGTGAGVFVDDIILEPAAQLVTVSGTPGATGPSDFEFLGQALDSFRVGGVNAGNPLPNVIHVTGSATGGVVQLASGSPALYSLRDDAGGAYEDITIVGHDGTSSARRTVLIGNETATPSDGFDITTDADLVFENLNFIPQSSHTFADDMITLDRQTVGASTMTFRNCYFGPNNGSNAPADVTGQTAGTVGAGGGIADDLITHFPDSGEDLSVTVENCVFHAAGGVGSDGLIIAPNGTAPNAAVYTLTDSVFSFNGRLGVQMSAGAGETVNASGLIMVRNGQGAPASFGNAWYTFNTNAATMTPLTDSIAAQNYDRNISLNGAAVSEFTALSGCIISDTLGGGGSNLSAVLSNPGAGVNTITVTDTTFHNTNNGTVILLGDDPVVMSNVIIAGAGGTENGISGAAAVTVTDSAIVLEGANSLNGGVAPGYTATAVTEVNVIPHTPDFAQTTNPFASDYFDVRNPTYQTAGPAGGELTGGADYVGGGVPVTLSAFELE